MSFITDTFFGGAEEEAGRVQAEASEQAVAEQRRQFDITQANLQPFLEAGTGALTQQQALLGLSGTGAQQDAFSAFADSPGQQFLRERGERALLRNASAIGGLGGGNVRSALQQQGIGFAQQQFQNQFNQLAGISGTGQTTGAQLGQLGAQSAAQIGAGLERTAEARASGILGQSAGRREGIGQVAGLFGLFSDVRLKTNIKKVGIIHSGLGWYVWDWTREALKIVGNQIPEGVMAHEAQELYPLAIGERNGFMTVDYRSIH